jgi:hypothetical protein
MTATTGCFRHDPANGAWEWDDEVYRIHGLEPQSVVPTTALVLASKHPDDREAVRRALAWVVMTGEPFSISYRLIAADGFERRVVLVAEGDVCGGDGGPSLIEGYYIDLTPDFVAEGEAHAQQAIAASMDGRAVVEQAKGALMLAYGLTSDEAHSMLRWWSRKRDLPPRDLAERVVALARDGEATDTGVRATLDAALYDLTDRRSTPAG